MDFQKAMNEELNDLVEQIGHEEVYYFLVNIKHDLGEVIVLSVLGVMAGADSWVEIERFGKNKFDWLKQFLTFKNGIPSHDTIGRIMTLLDPFVLQCFFRDWCSGK